MSDEKNIKFISLQEASKSSPYSQEYLRLLARQGKIVSKRIGRNWFTTETAVKDYIAKQSLTLVIPRSILNAANPELETGSQIRIGKGPETQESALFISTPDTGAIQKTEQTLETISDNIRQLSSLQDMQFKKIQEMELQQLRARDDAKIGSHVSDALTRISENLQQLSSVHDLQIRQMDIQRATVESHVAAASELGTIQKMQSAVSVTADKTEKLLEKINAGLAQYAHPQMPQSSELSGAQIRQSLDNITENLKQLSLVQDIQLKQIQLQQQSLEETVRSQTDRSASFSGISQQSRIEQVAQVANQEFLSQRTDTILEKIYMAVDRMVHAQEIQTMKPVTPAVAIASIADQEHQTKVATALEKITENLETIQKTQQEQAEILRTPVVYEAQSVSAIQAGLSEAEEEVIAVESESLSYKIKRFNYRGRHYFNFSRRTYGLLVASIVAIFLMMGGASFGNIDTAARVVKDFFKNADALQGHFPGTHANEVLLLDHAGNVSIYGHVETQGQLRSFAPDGVAPITVDSRTLVENLNAEYLDGLASKDFTLAFVTKNGNVTHDNVFLEGKVEVGKTLTVKGATNLLNSLSVDGGVTVNNGGLSIKDGGVTVDRGDVRLATGNLVLDKGTIKINDRNVITNLDADLFDGLNANDFTLDRVVNNGNTAHHAAFFDDGLWGSSGAFGSLGVSNDARIGDQGHPEDSAFTVFSKKFTLDESGNINARGMLNTGGLIVGGTVQSDLVPSGSFNLGSDASHWNTIFANTLRLSVASSSYFYGADGSAVSPSFSFSADHDTGLFRPATNSIGFTTFGVERARITANGRFGINTATISTQFEVNGTTSASAGIFTGALNTGLGSAATVAYSRFGTNTTSHGLSASSDVLISGNLEIDAQLYIDGSSNLTGVSSASSYYAQGRTAASPSFSFTTDKDTGLFSPAANTVAFSTGGSERFRIDSSGRVGINTTAPSTLFEVQGTSSASYGLFGTLQVGGFSSVSYNRFGTTATTHSNYISASNDLLISGDLEVRSSLSVGGPASISGPLRLTTTPDASATGFALQLGGTLSGGDSSGTYFAFNAPSSFNGTLAHIQKNGSDYFKIINNGSTELLQLTATNYVNSSQYQVGSSTAIEASSGLLRFATSSGWTGLQFNTGGSERMRIDSSGFVGIGTSAPATKFEVQGTASASYLLTGNTLQVGGFSSAAYSRFGTATTSHSNYITTINDVLVSGDVEVNASAAFDGNVAIGDSSSDLVAVNSQFISNLIPFTNAYDIGSTANRWRKIYVDSADITNLTAASASISGTVASDFTINSDNATADTEDASVTFERGTPTTNAVLSWSSSNKRFGFNFPVFLQTTDASEASLNFTKLTLKGATNQTSNDYFEIQNVDSSRLFIVETGGAVVASGAAQFGGLSVATASYSRFGTANTTHSATISSANDLLISGDLEVDNNVYFDGTVNFGGISSAAYFYAQSGTAASPSFSFTSDKDTGIFRPAANTIAFSTTASERLRIDSSGFVGINTTTPSTTFEVQGTSSASFGLFGTLQVGGFASTSYNRLGTTTTTHSNYISASNDLLVSGDLEGRGSVSFAGTASFSNALYANSGYVVVGRDSNNQFTTQDTSNNLLTVRKDQTAFTKIELNNSSTANGAGTNIRYYVGSTVGAGTLYDNFLNKFIIRAQKDSSSFMTFETGGANNERLRIDATGLVGIGTTSLSTKLEVAGTASASAGVFTSALNAALDGVATVAYSRFGTTTTTHGLSVASDLLISGKLEVDSAAYFDGTVNFTGTSSASLFYAGNGTAASPSFAFRADQDTGMYRPAANQLGFSTLGAERIRINDSGFVGVGTTTPSTTFEVQGTSSASFGLFGTLQVGGFASTSYNRLGTTTTTHSNYISASNDLLVSGDLEGRGSLSFAGPSSLSNTLYVGLAGNTGKVGINTQFASVNGLTIGGAISGAGGFPYSANSSQNLVIGVNSQNGTETTAIELAGAINTTSTDSSFIYFTNQQSGVSGRRLATIKSVTGTASVAHGELDFSVFNASSDVSRMHITEKGVGFLTAAPSTALEVQGTASASYFLSQNAVQFGGGTASVAYSRFGTSTTSHSNYISASNDLLISGDLDGKSSISFAGFASLSSALFADPSNHRVTVGRIDGGEFLDLTVVDNNINASLLLHAAADNNSDHMVRFLRSRGTVSSPTALQTGDPVGAISFRPYSGTGTTYTELARIVGTVNGTVAVNSIPTDIVFYTGATSATEKLRLTSNGRLGLNTTAPSTLFEVQGTSSASYGLFGTLQVGGFSSVSYNRFGTTATTHGNYISASNDLLISGDLEVRSSLSVGGPASISNSLFIPTAGGNVGIGTTSPGAILDISASTPELRLRSGGTAYFTVSNQNGGTNYFQLVTQDGSSVQFTTFSANNPLVFKPNNVESVRFATNGFVGIGTATPATKLQVQGTASASYFLTGNTLQVGGFSSVAYSRFGTATTTHTNFITTTNDVLVSGDLEVRSSLSIVGPASISSFLFTDPTNSKTTVGRIDGSAGAFLNVVGNTVNAGLFLQAAADSASDHQVRFIRSRGTVSSPTALQNSDAVGAISFRPYSGTGTSYVERARIVALVNSTAAIATNAIPTELLFYTGNTAAGERMRIDYRGLVGVGTTTPKNLFTVVDTAAGVAASSSFAILSSKTVGSVASISATSLTSGSVISIRVAPSSSFTGPILVAKDTNELVLASLSSGGRFSLRREIFSHGATSNCTGVGAPSAGCLDYAENYPATDTTIGAGDLVEVGADGNLIKSNNSSAVIGVISTKPGVVLGNAVKTGVSAQEKEDGQLPVALAGRIPVKVSLENGPIAVGDRLTVSSIPGVAAKASGPGYTVGLALETVTTVASSTYATVSMFVNLDWYGGDVKKFATADPSTQSGNTVLSGIVSAVENIWASKDIVSQGIKKTYFAISSIDLFKDFDIATLVENWVKRPIALDNNVPSDERALFSGPSAQAADQSKTDLKTENGNNYLATYGVDSTRGEITLSGSSELKNGQAAVFFDLSFSALISDTTPIRVIVTPTSATVGQLYVSDKNSHGFVVKQSNSSEQVKFDWLVIARRKGYEDPAASVAPTPQPSSTPVQVTPTPTPAIETTPTPESNPAPSLTPEPSVTPAVIPSESPIITPIPSAVSTPEPSIEPTPAPSATPSPEITPTPSPTSEPTPEPTVTPIAQ